jgi:iron complex outermembrane receptor protein
MRIPFTRPAFAVAGFVGALALTAHPQQVRAATAEGADNTLAEIVVTAEKRSESALSTPIALATFDSDTLKESQIISVSDLQNIDPSLNVNKGQFGSTVTIRGVTSVDGTSKGTPGIAFNIDGIPINRGYEQSEAFFDLERIELLKGPQGTLYGASSTGGALNIITAKPKDTFEAFSDVTVGNYNTRRTTDVLNLPIEDWLAVRAAVNYNYHDGYNTLADGTPYTNGENDFTTRLSALFRFSSDMTLLLQETAGNIGGPGPGGTIYQELLNAPTGSAQRIVYPTPFANLLDDTYSNFTWQFNWAIGAVHLAYVGGYLNFSANENSAATVNPLANDSPSSGGAFPFFTEPNYAWRDYRGHFLTDSHELRLSNEQPGPVDWVLGANWYRENIHESDHNWTALATVPNEEPTVADSVNGIDPVNNTIHTAKGVFGQATWHATDALDFTGGLRYTQDSLNRYGTFAAGPVPGCVAPADCIGGPNNGSETDSKTTYRANVSYHFTKTQMLYATVASGFKGGGFNDFCGSGPCPYGPEELVSYEIGYKGRPVENFEWNSDLFYYDYSARQISQLNNVDGSLVIFTSVYPAVVEGWENGFRFLATPADVFDLNVTLLRSHLVQLNTYLPSNTGPIGAPIDLAGRTLDMTPDVAATLGYTHTFQVHDGATVKLHLYTKYSSSYYETNIGPFISYTQPSFTRSNADLRYTFPSGKAYVGAFITNIENKLQITAPPSTPAPVPNAQGVSVTDPRTWGFTAGVRF